MGVLSNKSKSYLKKILDQATPFKGLLEISADLIGPIIIRQVDSLILERYVEQGYQDEVNRFVEALDNEDLDAAKTELETLTEIIPNLPFLLSEEANDLFYKGLLSIIHAAIEEMVYRKNPPEIEKA